MAISTYPIVKGRELDKVLAILGVFSSIVLSIFVIIFIGRIIYTLPLFLTFLSCIIWLIIRKHSNLQFKELSSNSIFLSLIVIFLLLFSCNVLFVYFRPNLYERPLSYFLVSSIMAGIISLEILFSKKNQYYLILFQIIIMGLFLAWSQILIFPSLVGIDPWWHKMFTSTILQINHIPENYIYSRLPMFHLLIASTSLLTTFDYKVATMLSVSLVQIICNVLFIFLLGKYLFNSYKTGLLASLLLSISNMHIFMSYWSIPNSFAAIFILPIFYILFKLSNKQRVSSILILLIFQYTMILTHALTSTCMAILLVISWLGSILYNKVYYTKTVLASISLCVLFTSSMFAWWTYASGHIYIFGSFIKWGFSRDSQISTPHDLLISSISIVPLSEQIFNMMGIFTFFTLSFIGCFYMISRIYGTQNTFIFAIIGIVPLALGFFSLISQHSILEGRWWFFSQILLSIPFSVAILILCNLINKPRYMAVFIFFLTVSVTFLLIISQAANIDNLAFSPNSNVRYSLTASELQAISTNLNYFKGPITTDNYYSRTQMYTFNVQSFDDDLYNHTITSINNKLILVRDEIFVHPFLFFTSIYKLDRDQVSQFNESNFLKIYNCGSVKGYFNKQILDIS